MVVRTGIGPQLAESNVPTGGLQSVLTALDLLDCFAANEAELGVSQLAAQLGVAKSTAHRLLTTLCVRGFAEKNAETGRYRLGLRLHELGTLVVSRLALRRSAMPLLEELRERTGHTIHLAVADRSDVLHLERLETLRGMRLFTGITRRLPVHCTASGKAIAAFDPVCAAARCAAGFPVLTESTIRTAADFEKEIQEVRRRGFAMNHDEVRDGASSVAAPVLDRSGLAHGAISIVAPSAETENNIERHARLVGLAAAKIANALCI